MSDCLVTKLKGTVNDSSLYPMGTLVLKMDIKEENAYKNYLYAGSVSGRNVTITTDKNLKLKVSNNFVESYNFPISFESVLLPSGKYNLIIYNYYYAPYIAYHIKYNDSVIDVKKIKFGNNSYIEIDGFGGDIASIKNNIENSRIIEISGRMENNSLLYGDMSNYSLTTASHTLISITKNDLKIDIGKIIYQENNRELNLGGASKLFGDISKLGASIRYINSTLSNQVANTDEPFTWSSKTSRPSSSNIVFLFHVKLGNDVDKMLINQSNCVYNPISNESWNRSIIVYGNHDANNSEANAAIEKLTQMGAIVNIRPIA